VAASGGRVKSRHGKTKGDPTISPGVPQRPFVGVSFLPTWPLVSTTLLSGGSSYSFFEYSQTATGRARTEGVPGRP
jgi:hypothetical protein